MMGAFSELARIRKSALSSASSILQRASIKEMSGHVDCSPFKILCNVESTGQ